MNTQIIRHAVLMAAVLAVGLLLTSMEMIRRVDAGRWSLDVLVGFTAFTLAAMIAVTLAQTFQSPHGKFTVRSSVLARALAAVFYGLTAWLLTMAVGDVLVPAWVKFLEGAFAVVILALAAYVLWIVFSGFDEIAHAVKSVPSVAQAPGPTPEASPAHCTQCGAAFQSGQKFCGACGAPRA